MTDEKIGKRADSRAPETLCGAGGGGAPSANTCEEEAALRSQRDTPHLVLLGAHGAAKSLKIRPVHMT